MPDSATDVPNDADLALLRRTIDLAKAARDRGDHPFGALLAGRTAPCCSRR